MSKMFDRDVFDQIRTHARDLKGAYGVRDQEFKEYEKMYLMDFDARQSKFENADIIKKTASPSARNKVIGALRLLMSQDPIFDIKSERFDDAKAEAVEKSISRWWEQSGRAVKRPLHYDMILSASLYDEIHTAVTVMDDYKVFTETDRRAERISKMTPILFQSWNPRQGYPEFDELGLCSYYRETTVKWSYVAQKYKDLLKDNVTFVNKKTTDNVLLKIFYDLDHYAIWINEEDPFVCEEHGLPCIPIDVTLINGSSFFEREEDRRQPLLFGIKRSNLWKNESLLYTVLYSLLFTIGVTPTFVYKTDSEDNLDIRNDGALQYIQMRRQDSIDPLDNKGILPPEVQRLSEITGTLINESTMYNTAFGDKGGNSQTFSETSLLQQAARLPLIGPQRLGGFGISSTVEMALMLMKEKGLSFDKNGYRIKASEIPDDIEVKAKLDVILPQEKLQMVNVGISMQKLGMPNEYVQSNLLGITNTKEIKDQFVKEQTENALLELKLQQKVKKIQQAEEQAEQAKNQQLQAAIQAAQQAAAGGGQAGAPAPEQAPAPAPSPVPPMTDGQMLEAQMMQQGVNAMDTGMFAENTPQPGEIPPEMMGQPMPGAEMEGGLPPAMGGMIPGQGPAMPEEGMPL